MVGGCGPLEPWSTAAFLLDWVNFANMLEKNTTKMCKILRRGVKVRERDGALTRPKPRSAEPQFDRSPSP